MDIYANSDEKDVLVKDDGEYKLESTKGVMLEAYDASDKAKKSFNSYGCCRGMFFMVDRPRWA